MWTRTLYKVITTCLIKTPGINYIYHRIHMRRYNPIQTEEGYVSWFENIRNLLKQQGLDYKDKTILEIGAGNKINTGLCFLLTGCEKFLFSDKFQCLFQTNEEKKKFTKMINICEKKTCKKFDKEFFKFNDNKLLMDKKKVSFLTCDAEQLDLPDSSVDFILSSYVLEHLFDLEKAFDEFHRVLKKGGFMVHHVHLANHKDFARPFDILKYSDYFWNNFLCAPETYQNRFRASHYKEMLESKGFTITLFEQENNTGINFNRKEHKLNQQFLSLTDVDLNVLFLTFIAVKN